MAKINKQLPLELGELRLSQFQSKLEFLNALTDSYLENPVVTLHIECAWDEQLSWLVDGRNYLLGFSRGHSKRVGYCVPAVLLEVP